jgi:hypothetical protein
MSEVLMTLDMGPTVTGFAVGDLYGKLPIAEFWELPESGGEGAVYRNFTNALYGAIEDPRPTKIYIENPLPVQAMLGHCRPEYILRIHKMRGDVYEAGNRLSIPVLGFSADTVRHELLGRCRWPGGSDEAKRVVLAHVRGLGLNVTSFDAADAVMIWLYGQFLWECGRSATGRNPLFRDAAD